MCHRTSCCIQLTLLKLRISYRLNISMGNDCHDYPVLKAFLAFYPPGQRNCITRDILYRRMKYDRSWYWSNSSTTKNNIKNKKLTWRTLPDNVTLLFEGEPWTSSMLTVGALRKFSTTCCFTSNCEVKNIYHKNKTYIHLIKILHIHNMILSSFVQ